jgi:Uma2 family endonuclease
MIPGLQKPKASEDKVVLYYDRTWEQFKYIQKGLAGSPGLRLFFYQGVVEVLRPGQPHEIFKRVISSLLDYFFLHFNITVTPTGSVTQEQEGVASTQADDSFCFGDVKPIPDLSIEVIFISGSIAKLKRYQALGIPEVWFWEAGLLTLHRLGENGYTRIYRSQIPELERLDIDLLSRCVLMGETDWLGAVQTFREEITKTQ